jgi:hypothetical protein
MLVAGAPETVGIFAMAKRDTHRQGSPPARSPAGLIVTSLAMIALALAYYAWVYSPRDYLVRAIASNEHIDMNYVRHAAARRFANAIDGQPEMNIDFTWHFYPAGIVIYGRGIPGYRYFNSAFFALCLNPLSRLGRIHATQLWTGLEFAWIGLLALVPGVHFARRSRLEYYLYLALVLTSLPVLHNLMWGQISVPLVVLVLGSFCFYVRGRRLGAALLLALATSIKFYPAVLAVYFLLKREFRLLAMYAACTATFLVAVPAARLGVDGLREFSRRSNEMIGQVRYNAWFDPNSQYLPHVLGRCLGLDQQDRTSLGRLAVASYGLAALNVLLLWGMVRARAEHETEAAFALLLLSTPLLVETSWPHYFAYLPFCQVVAYHLLSGRTGWGARFQYALLGVSIALSSSVLFNQLDDFRTYSRYGFLCWSNMLLLLLVYANMIPAVRDGLRRAIPAGTSHAPARPKAPPLHAGQSRTTHPATA